jgi:hypothetical protein
MLDNDNLVYADLRDKLISRADAVVRLMELRWAAEDAEMMVEDWCYQIDTQKDYDDERESGWSA